MVDMTAFFLSTSPEKMRVSFILYHFFSVNNSVLSDLTIKPHTLSTYENIILKTKRKHRDQTPHPLALRGAPSPVGSSPERVRESSFKGFGARCIAVKA